MIECLVKQRQLLVISQCSSGYHPLMCNTDSAHVIECRAMALLSLFSGLASRFSGARGVSWLVALRRAYLEVAVLYCGM